MTRFANLSDAGRRLAAQVILGLADTADPLVLAVLPNGAPVAIPVARALGVRAIALPVDRTDDPAFTDLPDVGGRAVIVIDDGVETGTIARAAAVALRPLGPAELVLAVPVCPHDALADLRHRYDRIIAVDRPFGRRDLAWHFEEFDTVDDAAARALLADS